jgi:flagellar motor switch/type III secretory pathway protein FliN
MAAAVEKPVQQGAEAKAVAPNHGAPKAAVGAQRESADELRWKPVLELPCDLLVDLPLPNFRIADLLKLRPGSVIDAQWRVGRDVPLRLNGALIGWIEFEVMGDRLAVRLTELA